MKKLICVMITLVLLLAAVCAASAETIQAKPATIDINRLEGRMVKTDIDYKEGDIMTLTLYENERFDAAAVRAVKVGDVIVTDGDEITIESIEADGPDIIFNKGTENEMLFCDAGNDEFEHVMESDYGLPCMGIEKEYINTSTGQLRTRFQAFVEALEMKKIAKEG